MSLVELQRKQFLNALESVKPPNRYKIVVVDQRSLKLLGGVLKLSEILDFDVIRIDSIDKRRKPEPDVHAMYILTPSEKSIVMLIKDFTITGQHNIPGGTMYKAAHLFFTSELPDLLFKRVTTSPIKKYIAALKELCVEFDPVESRLFLTKLASFEIYRLYSDRYASNLSKEIELLSRKLANVCKLWGTKPAISYFNLSSNPGLSAISRQVAQFVESELEKSFSTDSPDVSNADSESNTTKLLILDRSIDYCAPLLHEFTYEAMAIDLVHDSLQETKNGKKYTYYTQLSNGEMEKKTAELDENDQVWLSFRHEHISDAQERIMKEIDQLAENNKAIVEMQSGKQQNLSKMRDIVSAMPKFKAKMAEYSVHVNLMQQCMKIFSANDLANIGLVEQNLVMRTTPEKVPYSTGSFDVANLLSNAGVDPTVKKRLLLIYLLTNPKLTENERTQLVTRANLGRDSYDSLTGLQKLISIDRSVEVSNRIREVCKSSVAKAKARLANSRNLGGVRGPNPKASGGLGFKGASPLLGLISSDKSGSPMQGNRHLDSEPEKEPYDVSRYEPVIKSIIEALVIGQLDDTFFRTVSSSKSGVDDVTERMKDMSFRKQSSNSATPSPSPGISRSLRSTKATWQKSKSQSASIGGGGSSNKLNAANSPGMGGPGDRFGSPFDKGSSKGPIVRKGPKLIVFVIGGVTYSEIRAANEIANSYSSDLILGSSHTITPNNFLDGLASIISADRSSDYDESKVLANEAPGAQLEPSPYIFGYATGEGVDPLVKYEEIAARQANRNKQNAAVAEVSLEDAFMSKLRSGEDQWNSIKSMSGSREPTPEQLDSSRKKNTKSRLKKFSASAEPTKTGEATKKKFFKGF